MPGFFEAFNKLQSPKKKVHTVTIKGQSIVVTLEQKLDVIKNGEYAYEWTSPTTFALKEKPKTSRQFPTLEKSELGYVFKDRDPFWVDGIDKGGHTWQIKSE
tara:strand:- start:26 stop:331 length:306 start_codon:yes stop_codon:yes gene_type:complete